MKKCNMSAKISDATKSTLIKYIFVGIVATLIFYISANCLEVVGLNEFIATFLGNALSFIFGYFAQMRFTFATESNHKTMIPRYLALLALIFIYGQIVTFAFSIFEMRYIIASAFIALSVPIFSYPLQKYWVFATNKMANQA